MTIEILKKLIKDLPDDSCIDVYIPFEDKTYTVTLASIRTCYDRQGEPCSVTLELAGEE